MRVLWISPFAPYDTVGHGGGQNHNYYLKYLKKNTDFEITLITVCDKKEVESLDLEIYKINNVIRIHDKNKLKSKWYEAAGKLWIRRDGGLLNNAKYHLLRDAIKEYVKKKEVPDVIITQWTETTIAIESLRTYFPDSYYIAIEEDVAFLGYKRKYEDSKGLYKLYKLLKYKCLKKAELKALVKCNLIVPLNDKDRILLLEQGILDCNMLQMSSYHGFYEHAHYDPNENQLLFYGAMSRAENYKSVIWFIEKVMPILDKEFNLLIVGSNPTEDLMKYGGDRIKITGFVENVQPYFENCLCLVSPLFWGAGIKIKVLEALSAGLPVITNDIGSEGIGLTHQVNYLHCESPDEYVEAITILKKNRVLRKKISELGREHVKKYFNVDHSLNKLIDRISINEKRL